MIVSDLAVKNRITVYVLILVILAAGLICYFSLPREAAPDINIPHVFISTFYRGVSPADMEKSVTMEIENKLRGLDHVKKISSVSAEGLSSIDVEFVTGTDIDQAVIDVKDKVDQAKPDLPVDLEDDPHVQEFNFSDLPILIFSLSGKTGLRELTELAKTLEEDIEGLPGVQEVDVIGGAEREIQVQVHPERMALYGVTFFDLDRVVHGENQNVSGGNIRLEEGKFQLRVPGEFETMEDVESIVVAVRDDEPVYLRDIAVAVDGLEDKETTARIDGRTAVTIEVKKRGGENAVKIVDAVDAYLAEARATFPPGTQITRIRDSGEDIRNMVADLENNIVTGLILVIVVVCCAMGLRNAVLVSLSIPLSMLVTFIILRMLKINLNMVVLFSLTLALGMLVDNAIVIVENIYRFMQQGVPRLEAARRATGEVAWPIIGSALTTIGAFVPLLWWTGLMGEFMIYLPITVIVALASCLFVALVINPALAAAVMRARSDGVRRSAEEVMGGGESPMLDGGGRILQAYRWLLRRALRFRLAVVALAAGVLVSLVLTWYLVVGIRTPVEFFPSIDPDTVYVNMKLPEGADLPYADGMVREVAARLFDRRAGSEAERTGELSRLSYREALRTYPRTAASSGNTYDSPSWVPDVRFISEKASVQANAAAAFSQGSDNQVSLTFVDLEDRTASTKEAIETIRGRVEGIPGVEITVEGEEGGPPSGSAINIEISGHDFAQLGRVADEVKALVKMIPFVRNVRHDYQQGSPTLRLKLLRKRAGLFGLTAQDVGNAIRYGFNGVEVSTWRTSKDDYDIVVRLVDEERDKIATLERIFLPLSGGGMVPLTTVVDIEYAGAVGRITRIDHKRVVTVQADVDETKTTGATARLKAMELLAGSNRLSSGDLRDPDVLLRGIREADAAAGVGGDPAPAPPADASRASGAAGTSAARALRLRTVLWGGLQEEQRTALRRIAERAGDDTERVKAALVDALNRFLFASAPVDLGDLEPSELPPEAAALWRSAGGAPTEKQRGHIRRLLLESAFPGALAPSPPQVNFPPGVEYAFTGEDEHQKESEEFLGTALGVACMLIVFILVAQFNSIITPIIIMSAVFLSLAGAFLGLALFGMPFGVIMTGVGIISLAGVVVNNAIVLVDYTQQLIDRGMSTEDAIVAAGATRLRPVLLTAITTVLGLIPMVTGISYDFHTLEWVWVSESSQWWRSMAVPVIFGLGVATMMTLLVVPVLFSLLHGRLSLIHFAVGALQWSAYALVHAWWRLFDRRAGTAHAESWALTLDEAMGLTPRATAKPSPAGSGGS